MPIPTRLAQAKQLAVYWDNYVNYLSTVDDRQPGIGTGDPKTPQTPLYVKPFGYDIATEQYIEANGTAARWATWGSLFTGHTKDSLTGTETVLSARFTPARIVIKEGLSTTKQIVTAKTTKRKYITYGGTSGSIPFGIQTATDDEVTTFSSLRNAIKSATQFNAQTMRVSRVKEKA